MPRIGYARVAGDVADLVRRRRGGTLSPLDLLLGHNPEVLSGWNSLLNAVRSGLSLPDLILEAVVLRIGTLNGSEYEWQAHLAPAQAAGVSSSLVEIIGGSDLSPTGSAALDVALVATDELTRTARLSDLAFAHLTDHFGEKEVAELLVVISCYNMVSRFLNGLNVVPGDRRSL